MNKHILLEEVIKTHPNQIGKVVDFNPNTDRLFKFDFTAANTELSPEDVNDTEKFSNWVNKKLLNSKSRYGIGGYMEHRTLYARSELFNTDNEPRRLHLGIDIWAEADTPVYVPISGHIHSFANNDHFGDYGPTIILKHQLNGLDLYSLYGHLNRECLQGLATGAFIPKGKQIGVFGDKEENGHWPPHLHFQLMFDMEGCYGDYPGVGRFSEKGKHLVNIPDPNLILRFPEVL
ncbi:MAG TPA: peptidoglycan DD-metalloendopeptidase family protein [Mucilaginibacter sp.]|nr:peptidoglycan DD-metalloendopeptidase family protein [Mucilaginibacter sp.]